MFKIKIIDINKLANFIYENFGDTTLELSNCMITDNEIGYILKLLNSEEGSRFDTINLSGTQISNKTLLALLEQLLKNQNIQVVNLKGLQIKDLDSSIEKSLYALLNNCQNLSVIDLSDTKFSDEFVTALKDSRGNRVNIIADQVSDYMEEESELARLGSKDEFGPSADDKKPNKPEKSKALSQTGRDEDELDSELPGYVGMTPFVVESDVSSDEEEVIPENKSLFRKHDDGYPYLYRVNLDAPKRGTVSSPLKQPEPSSESNEDVSFPKVVSKVTGFHDTITKEAFSSTDQQADHLERLQMVYGLNRRKSISDGRNKQMIPALQGLQEAFTDESQQVKGQALGFYWQQQWEKWDPNKLQKAKKGEKDKPREKGAWVPATFEEVRLYHRQLRQYDSKDKSKNKIVHHKEFRERNEKASGITDPEKQATTKRLQVPFRGIREQIKNSIQTEDAVRELRGKSDREIYAGTFDADMQSIQSNGKDAFSRLDEINQQYSSADVISTGYRGKKDDEPMTASELGVEMDQAVRIATAAIFAPGIYYPEPMQFFKTNSDINRVTPSFEKAGEKTYADPNEGMVIIQNLYKDAQKKPEMIFDASQGSIVTDLPDRMKTSSSKMSFNDQGYSTNWKKKDLQEILGLSQNHSHLRNWATSMARGFKMDARLVDPIALRDSKKTVPIALQTEKGVALNIAQVETKMKGFLTNLFALYHPYYIAEKLAKEKSESFEKCLGQVVRDYSHYVAQQAEEAEKILQSMEVCFTNNPKESCDLAHNSAKSAGKAVVNVMQNHLKFPGVSSAPSIPKRTSPKAKPSISEDDEQEDEIQEKNPKKRERDNDKTLTKKRQKKETDEIAKAQIHPKTPSFLPAYQTSSKGISPPMQTSTQQNDSRGSKTTRFDPQKRH